MKKILLGLAALLAAFSVQAELLGDESVPASYTLSYTAVFQPAADAVSHTVTWYIDGGANLYNVTLLPTQWPANNSFTRTFNVAPGEALCVKIKANNVGGSTQNDAICEPPLVAPTLPSQPLVVSLTRN